MLQEISISLLGVVIFIYGIDFAINHRDDPREPPRVASTVPIIGHLLGLTRSGTAYYSETSKKTDAEMYTISVLNQKIYVANSQRLTPVIQRAKTLSFRPFVQKASKIFGDATDETHALFGDDLVDDFSIVMRDALAPGPALDDQNLRMAERAIVDIEELKHTQEVNLMEWCRRTIVQATSCGVFGQQHPFLDPEVEEAFWKWEAYKAAHIAGLDFLGKGYVARQKVFDGFRKYFENMPSDASHIIRERQRILRDAGVPFEDRVKQDAAFCTAAFPNTAPTLFWTIIELVSRPEVMNEVREEVMAHAVKQTEDGNRILDVAALKAKCPLLLSVYQETQRTRHIHANIRFVTEDTNMDGKYLLKKGSYVQMPGEPIHRNTSIWGSDALTFDPYRFCARDGKPKITPSSFLSWGAPPHLCPARQFASTEIMIVVALLILTVDLVPAGGELKDPGTSTAEISTLAGPKNDVCLTVVPSGNGGKWLLEMGDSKTRVSLASG